MAWLARGAVIMKGKLVMLFSRLVLFVRNVGRNRSEKANKDRRRPFRTQFAWPHVMNSSVAIRGPLAVGTWIWYRQHAPWHHGYYRAHR